MKLWRVILSIHLKSSAKLDGLYSYTMSPATFYVHAVSTSDAKTMAIALVSAGVSPYDKYRTSGSVIAVDNNLEPRDSSCCEVGADGRRLDDPMYHSWSDFDRVERVA